MSEHILVIREWSKSMTALCDESRHAYLTYAHEVDPGMVVHAMKMQEWFAMPRLQTLPLLVLGPWILELALIAYASTQVHRSLVMGSPRANSNKRNPLHMMFLAAMSLQHAYRHIFVYFDILYAFCPRAHYNTEP